MKCKKGFKQKKGKCVKSNSNITKGKKSYNPFKMMGSWIGGGLLGGLAIYVNSSLCKLSFMCGNNNHKISYLIQNIKEDFLSVFLGVIILFIIGFLIGWGVQSLFRRFRK